MMGRPSQESWLNKQTLSWAGFDVASSVYFGLAPAVLLPLYFQYLLKDFANPTAAWGLLAAFAILASSAAALAAAAASAHISRLSLLMGLTAALVLSISALGWPLWPSLAFSAAAYVAAQSFYFAATSVYDSFLPDLLPQATRQRLSGFGWALGYVGGIFAIIVLLALIRGKPQSAQLLEQCFATLAIISAVFFTIMLRLMQRMGLGSLGEGEASPRLSGVWSVLKGWRQHRHVFLLLAGTMLVHLAVSVVITFTAPILNTRFGQTLPDLLWLLLLVHVLAVPSTLGWNMLMTNRSRLAPMGILLTAWGFVLLLMAFGSGRYMPLITVAVIGCCGGATAASLRGFLAEVAPPGAAAPFFALATVAGRVAAALGPAIFALITMLKGERTALLCILLLLAIGAALVIAHLMREDLKLSARQQADGTFM